MAGRRDRNRGVLTRTRSVTKQLRQAVEAGDKDLAAERLRLAERELRRAASKGVLPSARVDRAVSRLARAVHQDLAFPDNDVPDQLHKLLLNKAAALQPPNPDAILSRSRTSPLPVSF